MEPKKEEEEKKKGGAALNLPGSNNKPSIPTLKDSAGRPQLKIKGVAQSGLSLIDRLKQFKKKDLAFIMAGLGVLFMAPLAEHFMMAPEGQNGMFEPGISSRGNGSNPFGGSSSPYETGGSSMAPGSALGGNGDVITPLNVRDPSALVMGPGANNQAPAGSPSAGPTPPPDKKESSDWKDALANSAASAGRAATKAAGPPGPKPQLGGSGLRGLGAIGGGGGGGSFNALAAPSAANVPNRAAGSNSLQGIKDGSNIKGVASRGPGSGAGGAFDDLKKKAGIQGSDFNRNGQGAGAALEQAAGRNMNADQSNGGASGESNGGDNKAPGGNSGKDSKSVGESLEFLRQKAEQDHSIDLEWKLKEKAAMRWPNLEDKILEEAVMTPFKAVTAAAADFVKSALSGEGGSLNCIIPGDTSDVKDATSINISKGDIGSGQQSCTPTGGEGGQKGGSYYYFPDKDNATAIKLCGSNATLNCNGFKATGDGTSTPDGGDGGGTHPKVPAQTAPIDTSAGCSQRVKDIAAGRTSSAASATSVATSMNITASDQQAYTAINKGMGESAQAENALNGVDKNLGNCGVSSILGGGTSINSSLASSKQKLQQVLTSMRNVNSKSSTATQSLTQTETSVTQQILQDLPPDPAVAANPASAAQVDKALGDLKPAQDLAADNSSVSNGLSDPASGAKKQLDDSYPVVKDLETSLTRTKNLLDATSPNTVDGLLRKSATDLQSGQTINSGDTTSSRKDDVTQLVTQGNGNNTKLGQMWTTANNDYLNQREALNTVEASLSATGGGTGRNPGATLDNGDAKVGGQAAGSLLASYTQSAAAFKGPGQNGGTMGDSYLPLAGDSSYITNITTSLNGLKTVLSASSPVFPQGVTDKQGMIKKTRTDVQAISDKATNFISQKASPSQVNAGNANSQIQGRVPLGN